MSASGPPGEKTYPGLVNQCHTTTSDQRKSSLSSVCRFPPNMSGGPSAQGILGNGRRALSGNHKPCKNPREKVLTGAPYPHRTESQKKRGVSDIHPLYIQGREMIHFQFVKGAAHQSRSRAARHTSASRHGLPCQPPGNMLPDCPEDRNGPRIARQAYLFPYRKHWCKPSPGSFPLSTRPGVQP